MAYLTQYQYLTTEELILRPITLSDAPAVFSYTSDPRVAQFTHWNQHTSLDEAASYIHLVNQLKTTQVWGIQLHESKQVIGECSITQHENGRAEVYYALAQEHWGNGYTTQALTALITATQQINTISRLEAWIISKNLASCRVAQKVGLNLEQTITQGWHVGKTPHDISLYTCKINQSS